jgi:exoribonuclease-2
MEAGNIVEYIDQKKIICAVVLEVKKSRLRLLTETNREVNLSVNRLAHKSAMQLDVSVGRTRMVDSLKEISRRRKSLIDEIDIKELWDVLNTEQEWIDLPTMTEFCFPDNPTFDHEAAVVRAFFYDRLYFKFNSDRFFPNSEEQVERITIKKKEEAQKERLIINASAWLKSLINGNTTVSSDTISGETVEYINFLKSYYIHEKESEHYAVGKEILAMAGVRSISEIFNIFINLGVFDKNENLDLHRLDISTGFSDELLNKVPGTVQASAELSVRNGRKDLTGLDIITIDGQTTTDFDDAISIEEIGDHYRLGIHISDVGACIQKGDAIDREALRRGSSIYMPDRKIPMIPPSYAENICSLKAGETRPAITIMVKMSPFIGVVDYEIFPSLIEVKRKLTYYETNLMVNEDKDIFILHDLASKFRQYRFAQGAVQISLPEINVWLNENGEISLNRVNRESPGRMLVSEIMILANWLMASYLIENGAPAIFRTQPGPRERLYKGAEGDLFQNCMQRRLLRRFVLNHKPERHSGLGLDAYITATSPIRKYFDLVTQRQIRALLGLEKPYTSEEIDNIIQSLEEPMSNVSMIQRKRTRYWVLKYLEDKIGQQEEALVLYKRRNSYQILIPRYMIECDISISDAMELKPGHMIQVKLQHANARKDTFSVFLN